MIANFCQSFWAFPASLRAITHNLLYYYEKKLFQNWPEAKNCLIQREKSTDIQTFSFIYFPVLVRYSEKKKEHPHSPDKPILLYSSRGWLGKSQRKGGRWISAHLENRLHGTMITLSLSRTLLLYLSRIKHYNCVTSAIISEVGDVVCCIFMLNEAPKWELFAC